MILTHGKTLDPKITARRNYSLYSEAGTNNSKQEKLRVTNNDIIVMSLYFKYFQWSDFVPPAFQVGNIYQTL
jgi:hypothetical protein